MRSRAEVKEQAYVCAKPSVGVKVITQTTQKLARYITAQVGSTTGHQVIEGTLSVAHQVTVHCIRQCCRVAQEYGAIVTVKRDK